MVRVEHKIMIRMGLRKLSQTKQLHRPGIITRHLFVIFWPRQFRICCANSGFDVFKSLVTSILVIHHILWHGSPVKRVYRIAWSTNTISVPNSDGSDQAFATNSWLSMAILKTKGEQKLKAWKREMGLGLRLWWNFEFWLKRLGALFAYYFLVLVRVSVFGHSSVLYSWRAAYVTPFLKFQASPILYTVVLLHHFITDIKLSLLLERLSQQLALLSATKPTSELDANHTWSPSQ